VLNAAVVLDWASSAETGFTQRVVQRILSLHRLLTQKVSLMDAFRL
jgi:hypothetical protein